MEGISLEELQLAARNHGMPLEALRYPVTPVGLHYLLIHFDVPDVDPDDWRLTVRGDTRIPSFTRKLYSDPFLTPRSIGRRHLGDRLAQVFWNGRTSWRL